MKLRVFLKGKEIDCISLKDVSEFSIGRSSQCEYILKKGKKISRRHIRFFKSDDKWKAENLSRFNYLFYKSEPVRVLFLKHGMKFSAPPYQFLWEDQEEEVFEKESISVETQFEDTITSRVITAGILEITSPQKEVRQVFVNSSSLKVGTSDFCDEILEIKKEASSGYVFFELFKSMDGFFIEPGETELFKNGSLVSGRVELKSGDNFSSEDWGFVFAERNERFKNQDKNSLSISHQPQSLSSYEQLPPAVIFETQNNKKSQFIKKISGALLAVFTVFLLFSGGGTKTKELASEKLSPFDKLTAAQKVQVKHSFSLAEKQFHNRQFQFCIDEIKSIHNVLSSYKNSQELGFRCKSSLENKQIQAERKIRNEKLASARQKAQGILGFCKKKMSSFQSSEELDACLEDSGLFDIDTVRILRNELQNQIAQRENKKRQEKEFHKKVIQGQNHYRRATSFAKDTPLKERIKKLKAYLRSSYPQSQGLKNKVRRTLASIEKTLNERLSENLEKCRLRLENKNYKGSYKACQNVIKEDSENKEARALLEKVISEKDHTMRSYYEQATLEEGFANFEKAKMHWKKIMKEDVPEGQYYKKSKRKINQYGDL